MEENRLKNIIKVKKLTIIGEQEDDARWEEEFA